MIFELRIYHAAPGKLPALCKRFEEITFGYFAKHGIEVTEFWVDATADRLYYVCRYADAAARGAAWEAFQADTGWQTAKAATEVDGKLAEHIDSYMMYEAEFFTRG